MKALGKRKSNRDGTLLPVLSGGMSQAAVNKCVSNSGKEREREEKKERKREKGRKKKREGERQQRGTRRSLVRSCRRRPRGIRLNEEKTFKRAKASFVHVEIRLVLLSLRRVSFSEREID